MRGSRKDDDKKVGKPKAAIEIMILNPDPAVHRGEKGVHENLRIKQRFGEDNYLAIGVMLKPGTNDLQFYLFEDCDKRPHPDFFSSLTELKKHLLGKGIDIIDRSQKVYLMGHGDNESKYGFGNYHAHDGFRDHKPDPTEQIYGDDFDNLIYDILKAIPASQDTIGITLEECHTDNLVTARKVGETKSFLERLSAQHAKDSRIIFSGTGPWSDSEDVQESLDTGARASGGYPDLIAPITSMGGGIWRQGNTVIFHHNSDQIALRKSPFATTKTAKDLKINAINYARLILNEQKDLSAKKKQEIIARICANRKILTIGDLNNESDFPRQPKSANDAAWQFVQNEKVILKQEQGLYLQRVREILAKAEYSDRDVFTVALGLNHRDIFKGHEQILQEILGNKQLLKLVMVSCGKVLFAARSNNSVIDLLQKQGVPIDSIDDKGRTALHYAVQYFSIARPEQHSLVNKLMDCGASAVSRDMDGQTPLMLAEAHSKKSTVIGGESVFELVRQRSGEQHISHAGATVSKAKPSEAVILKSLGHQPGEKSTSVVKKSAHDDSLIKTTAKDKRRNERAAPEPTEKRAADDSGITYRGPGKK